MTSSQERTLRLNGIAAMISSGRYADAYDRAVEITSLGRTQRWQLAIGSLRIGLYDAACGQAADLDDLLAQAKRAAR
jgi:hypothetical protein